MRPTRGWDEAGHFVPPLRENLLLCGLAPDGVFRVPRTGQDRHAESLSGPPLLPAGRWALTLFLRPSRDCGRSSVVPTSRDVGGRLFTLISSRDGGTDGIFSVTLSVALPLRRGTLLLGGTLSCGVRTFLMAP